MKSKWLSALEAPVAESWNTFLTASVKAKLVEIEKQLEAEQGQITPVSAFVLRFLPVDLARTKVLILGQDPYPQEGVATGRAFEVGDLDYWEAPFRNTSLKNIVRSLYAAKFGKFLRYKQISQEGFQWILPPNRLFSHWEDQGVLLLNTSFTCRVGASNSHEKLWREFSTELVKYIADCYPHIYWFLWGNHAMRITQHVELKHAYHTMHPMLCAQKESRPNDFLFGNTNVFAQTSDFIDWYGVS